jgi:hypothetical protein
MSKVIVTIFVSLFVWGWYLGGTDEAAAYRFVDAAHSYGAMYQRIDCGLVRQLAA